MTVELKNWHWVLFLSLAVTQFAGLWISATRSPYGPAVVDFFMRRGWFGLVIPMSLVIGSAFTTTVIVAKLIEVLTKRQQP
jgi:Ni,Fe-hydrogenase I cytochrome b subunit